MRVRARWLPAWLPGPVAWSAGNDFRVPDEDAAAAGIVWPHLRRATASMARVTVDVWAARTSWPSSSLTWSGRPRSWRTWARIGPSGSAGETTPPLPRDAAVVKDWRYVGRGWANAGDTWLAETAAAELADARRHARQARRADTDHD